MDKDDLKGVIISIIVFIVICILSYVINKTTDIENSSDYVPTPIEINSVIFLI